MGPAPNHRRWHRGVYSSGGVIVGIVLDVALIVLLLIIVVLGGVLLLLVISDRR